MVRGDDLIRALIGTRFVSGAGMVGANIRPCAAGERARWFQTGEAARRFPPVHLTRSGCGLSRRSRLAGLFMGLRSNQAPFPRRTDTDFAWDKIPRQPVTFPDKSGIDGWKDDVHHFSRGGVIAESLLNGWNSP